MERAADAKKIEMPKPDGELLPTIEWPAEPPSIDAINALLVEAKQEMADMKKLVGHFESELGRTVVANHDLERRISLAEEEVLTTKLQCEDKLKNQHR